MTAAAHAVTAATLGAWLLKADPRATDVGALLAGDAGETTRCVRRSYRAALVAPGQPVLLWVSGADSTHPAGIHAQGRTRGLVHEDDDGRLVMPLTLEPLAEPVPRAALLAHPVLAHAEVLRMPAGSNPSYLTVDQLAVLRRDWPQVTVG
ncbi:hypothetical protein [Nocardioides solisilvae]|uniref:hypothetical protein n=1 Tax=Nocardioides solisilvae TaxID=1542435 RepID=UPI000D74D94A|nr:hypothetical protein [Nocardioides solisilvae]